MHAIENAAFVSVGRASGFAALGIFCLMFGLSFEPVTATRAGGVLCLVVSLILAFKALTARSRPYKKTETWIILPKEARPPAEVAQQLIGETLRSTYIWFAKQAAAMALALLLAASALQLAGVTRIWTNDPNYRPELLEEPQPRDAVADEAQIPVP